LISTETLFESPLTVTRSGLPSSLRSAIDADRGKWPVGWSSLTRKLPFPRLSSTETELGPKFDIRQPLQIKEYPLIDLRLSRNDCLKIIAEAGLPQPQKSSCYFCPMHRPQEWQRMQREEPEQFEKSCDLEELVNARRDALGKDHVYFTRFGRPLREVFSGGIQLSMADLGDGGCDSGYCWT